jgi:hypothetical protein
MKAMFVQQVPQRWQNSLSKVCNLSHPGWCLTTAAAEFQGSIGTSIPQIVDLLMHKNSDIRRAGVGALAKLSEQGM